MYKIGNKKTLKGFTLVELIIVITILGILSTIAYISFQGYTKDARDGVRISDIKQIYNGLSIYKVQTEKTLLPDNYINIQSGTTTISYQGYAGASVLRTLKISGGKDPGTKDYYIYTTDVNTKKAQLMTYMETSDKDVQLLSQLKDLSIINQAQAVTNTGYYQDKKIYVYGDKIGILTNNKIPLQETTTNTGIDIKTLTGNITTYFGGNVYSGGLSTSTGLTLINQINGVLNNFVFLNLTSSANSINNINVGGTNYIVHSFTSTGNHTLTTNKNVNIEYLVVGGGGGGGAFGGGGGGGFLTGNIEISSGTHVITVGDGGMGNTPIGQNGYNSSINSIIALGGGGGGGYNVSASTGSSGGGGGYINTTGAVPGASGTSGQGNNGGSGYYLYGNSSCGGGGGGAGGGGGNASTGGQGPGGAGGVGKQSSISGVSNYYAGGGGGGNHRNYNGLLGTGGTGGGGTGGLQATSAAQNGLANTGGGGGGGSVYLLGGKGANGGSGIVIIRFISEN